MRHPVKRSTYSLGSLGGYAHYNSFEDSIKDFYLWYTYTNMRDQNSLFDFVAQLKQRKYFEADLQKYYNGVLVWYNKLY